MVVREPAGIHRQVAARVDVTRLAQAAFVDLAFAITDPGPASAYAAFLMGSVAGSGVQEGLFCVQATGPCP